MKTNVGNKERIARVIAGLAILKSSKSKKMKLLALAPLISGATGHCPCYSKLGINTAGSNKIEDSNKHKKQDNKKQDEKLAKQDANNAEKTATA